MTSVIREIILAVVNTQHEVIGIFNLGMNHVGCNNIGWVREQLHVLEKAGQITMIPQGNGRPTIIRKRNRNSPGYPRRRA